jgi:hypothetical protein
VKNKFVKIDGLILLLIISSMIKDSFSFILFKSGCKCNKKLKEISSVEFWSCKKFLIEFLNRIRLQFLKSIFILLLFEKFLSMKFSEVGIELISD